MAGYHTIEKRGAGEYDEKKSRFLGEAIPVSSKEEIDAELARIRKQYFDARHHCFAYVLGEKRDNRRFSDDGEPSGTGGMPILNVIDGEACTGILIVVTRYFGGTLLGAGPLARAYGKAAKAALDDAGIVERKEGAVLQITLSYAQLDSALYLLKQEKIRVDDTAYTDAVALTCHVPEEEKAALLEKLSALGRGSIRVNEISHGFYGFDT
jgi:uncharacterized YigZ family protein